MHSTAQSIEILRKRKIKHQHVYLSLMPIWTSGIRCLFLSLFLHVYPFFRECLSLCVFVCYLSLSLSGSVSSCVVCMSMYTRKCVGSVYRIMPTQMLFNVIILMNLLANFDSLSKSVRESE